MFEDDEDLENSEDYVEMLSSEIDDIEELMDGECDASCDDCSDTMGGVVVVTEDMIAAELKMHSREADRALWTFRYCGEVLDGKVVSQQSPEKFLFSVMPDKKLRMINISKLNK